MDTFSWQHTYLQNDCEALVRLDALPIILVSTYIIVQNIEKFGGTVLRKLAAAKGRNHYHYYLFNLPLSM